jgi:hypothetical protein
MLGLPARQAQEIWRQINKQNRTLKMLRIWLIIMATYSLPVLVLVCWYETGDYTQVQHLSNMDVTTNECRTAFGSAHTESRLVSNYSRTLVLGQHSHQLREFGFQPARYFQAACGTCGPVDLLDGCFMTYKIVQDLSARLA